MDERKLTKDELDDREDYVKGMKKNKKDFKKRYGKDAESVMYATATKMAKEGVNESEESNVEEKKQENVQAEERQQDLNWLEDIKRLSGLENTYENSADAMKEYKVDESAETEQEVIAESAEQLAEKFSLDKISGPNDSVKSADWWNQAFKKGDELIRRQQSRREIGDTIGKGDDAFDRIRKSGDDAFDKIRKSGDDAFDRIRKSGDDAFAKIGKDAKDSYDNMTGPEIGDSYIDQLLKHAGVSRKAPATGMDKKPTQPSGPEVKTKPKEKEKPGFDGKLITADVNEEEQVDEVMPFVKMTYKEIQDDIKSTRQEIELGDEDDVDMWEPRLRDLLDMKDVVKSILNNKGWDTEEIVGAIMDSGLDTSVREELAEKFKKQVSKDPQVDEASGVRKEKKGKVDKSEKQHYHCKLTKDNKTKGVRMVADEGESEADVKARCKRENMGWELESIRKLDESQEQFDEMMGALHPENRKLGHEVVALKGERDQMKKRSENMEGKKKDHDGDGDIDSDDYLAARDKAIKAAMAKKVDELADLVALAGMKGKVELDELANEPGQGTEEVTNYSVADVIKQGDDLHKTKTQHADKAKLGDNPLATEEVDVLEGKLWKAYQAELEGVKK